MNLKRRWKAVSIWTKRFVIATTIPLKVSMWWSKTPTFIESWRDVEPPSLEREAKSPSDSSKTRTASCRGDGGGGEVAVVEAEVVVEAVAAAARCLRLRLLEHLLDVLRRLSDVFINQLGAVDDHQGTADVEAHRLGRQRLAGAGDAVKEGGDPLRFAVLLLEAPLTKEHRLR